MTRTIKNIVNVTFLDLERPISETNHMTANTFSDQYSHDSFYLGIGIKVATYPTANYCLDCPKIHKTYYIS